MEHIPIRSQKRGRTDFIASYGPGPGFFPGGRGGRLPAYMAGFLPNYGGPIGMYAKRWKRRRGRLIRRMGHELKQTVKTANGLSSATGQFICLTEVAQGLTEEDRVGNKIMCWNIHLRAKIIANSSGTEDNQCVRVIVFRDKKGEVGTPTCAGDLLVAADVYSPRESKNWDRYETLRDELMIVKKAVASGSAADDKILDWWIPVRKPCKYNGADADDYDDGMVWIMLLDEEVTYHPAYDFTSDHRFYDV